MAPQAAGAGWGRVPLVVSPVCLLVRTDAEIASHPCTSTTGYYSTPGPLFLSPERAAPGPTFPQRAMVIADLGLSYNSSTTMQHVQVSILTRRCCKIHDLQTQAESADGDSLRVGYRTGYISPLLFGTAFAGLHVAKLTVRMCAFLQYSSRNLPGASKSTYLLNVGDMVYAGAHCARESPEASQPHNMASTVMCMMPCKSAVSDSTGIP